MAITKNAGISMRAECEGGHCADWDGSARINKNRQGIYRCVTFHIGCGILCLVMSRPFSRVGVIHSVMKKGSGARRANISAKPSIDSLPKASHKQIWGQVGGDQVGHSRGYGIGGKGTPRGC